MRNSKFQTSKVVLGHDSLTQLGGAEKVVDAFHELFPESTLYVLVWDRKLKEKYKKWDIKTTWLQFFYKIYPHFQHWLLLIPLAANSVITDGEVLLTSSSGFARGFRIHKPGIHIDYCHTPTRFLWSDQQYIHQEVLVLLRPIAKLFLKLIKRWDYAAAQRVDYFIANSKETQKRIKQYYKRDSTVIYPGIDTDFWHPCDCERGQPGEAILQSAEKILLATSAQARADGSASHSSGLLGITKKHHHDCFLIAGRLHAHKRNDFIIEIFNELGLPLHVVGSGRQEQYLRSIAKPNITFYGRVSDEQLREHYRHAKGFIYPQIEDAGLMPLEAAACGIATIGIAKGGSLETIIPGVTGELFSGYNKEEIKQIILNWNREKYSTDQLRAHAENFSKKIFQEQILEFVNSKVNE